MRSLLIMSVIGRRLCAAMLFGCLMCSGGCFPMSVTEGDTTIINEKDHVVIERSDGFNEEIWP